MISGFIQAFLLVSVLTDLGRCAWTGESSRESRIASPGDNASFRMCTCRLAPVQHLHVSPGATMQEAYRQLWVAILTGAAGNWASLNRRVVQPSDEPMQTEPLDLTVTRSNLDSLDGRVVLGREQILDQDEQILVKSSDLRTVGSDQEITAHGPQLAERPSISGEQREVDPLKGEIAPQKAEVLSGAFRRAPWSSLPIVKGPPVNRVLSLLRPATPREGHSADWKDRRRGPRAFQTRPNRVGVRCLPYTDKEREKLLTLLRKFPTVAISEQVLEYHVPEILERHSKRSVASLLANLRRKFLKSRPVT